MIGWYFFSLWLRTFEFWKCSIRLPIPCNLAYVRLQIYIINEWYLFRFEPSPLFAMEHFIKPSDGLEISEVNEAVALVGAAFGVTGQVQEVVIVTELSVNFFREVLDGVFVGDVLDHKGGTWILTQALGSDDELA